MDRTHVDLCAEEWLNDDDDDTLRQKSWRQEVAIFRTDSCKFSTEGARNFISALNFPKKGHDGRFPATNFVFRKNFFSTD